MALKQIRRDFDIYIMTMNGNYKKLLIVDDDSGIRNQLKWSFDDFEVFTADSRLSAIAKIEKYYPSVVTLDLGLPPDEEGESEGFTILNQIMQIAPMTKVVIVSGSDNPANKNMATDLGAFDYYSKPIQIDQLKLIIEQAYQAYLSNCKE